MNKIPFIEIANHYKWLTPEIEQASYKYKRRWVDPYCGINWGELFSPIEEVTWQSIRCFGSVPLYPQYPVLKYYIDFANPVVKIGIECDGKEWHENRTEKDLQRDKKLAAEGWTIFRISGSDCVRVIDEYYDRYDMEKGDAENALRRYYTTVDGLIKAIGIFFFECSDHYFFYPEYALAQQCLLKYVSKANYKNIERFVEQMYPILEAQYQNLLYEEL